MGITAAITAALSSVGVGAATAGTIASIAAPALVGAGIGTVGSAVTGGDLGMGALTGGITGGVGGALGPTLTGLTGSVTAGEALAGAAGGALASGITGGDPLTGTLTGGASGALKGILSSSATDVPGAAGSTSSNAVGGGGAGGVASSAAPMSLGGSAGPDITNLSFTNPGSDFFSSTSPNVDSFLSGGSAADALSLTGPVAAVGPAASAVVPAASTNSIVNAIKNPSFSSVGDALSNNASILLPGAALGYQALQGASEPEGLGDIKAQADRLNAQGQELQSYLQSGKLPAGLQSSLTQAAQSAKATIRSQYASRGMSGSSAEAQDLANVDQRIQAQGASLAVNLLQQGITETNLSSQLYSAIMQRELAEDKMLSDSITNFATAAAGGVPGGGTTIRIGR